MRTATRAVVLLAAAAAAFLTIGAGGASAANVKVCKLVSPGSLNSLGSKEFSFTVTTNHPLYPGPYSVTGIRNYECRLLTRGYYPLDIPLIRPDGSPTQVTVTETMSASYVVQDVTVAGSRGVVSRSCSTDPMTGKQTCNPAIAFNLGPWTNVVTYTNRAAPILSALLRLDAGSDLL